MLNKTTLNSMPRLCYSLLILAGVLYPLAFRPAGTFPLSIISLAIFFCCLQNTKPKQAFFMGWIYGFLIFLVGCYWLYISAHSVGGAPAAISAILVLLLALGLGLFTAVFALITQTLFPREFKFKWIILASGLWTLNEYFRCHALYTGFSWLSLGYSQTGHILSGSSSIIGLYGVTWVSAIVAGLITEIIHCKKHSNYRNKLIITLLSVFIISGLLQKISWTKNMDKTISTSMIQGNITQSLKWDPDALNENIEIYKSMTNAEINSDFIIWPESAIPLFSYQLKELLNPLSIKAKNHNSTIFASIPFMNLKTKKYYNSIIMLGSSNGKYFKSHLVPFGEYFPVPSISKIILSAMHIPMASFSAGNINQDLLVSSGVKIAPFICYEIAYPDQALAQTRDANLLLTVSDDGWFGNSIALYQHLEMAQFHAQSLQRPLLFSSNNGITAAIDKHGVVAKRLEINKRLVLKYKVTPVTGMVPLQYFGYKPLWIILLLSMLFIIVRRKQSY
jgi:apolipoprotein N-acyltransferase